MRRTLIIAITAIVLIGIGAFVYFYFFTTPSTLVVTPGNTTLPISGQNPSSSTGQITPTAPNTIATPVVVSERLVKISSGPVVPGEVVVDTQTTASSSRDVAVHYIERQSGNVFTYLAGARAITRTNNQTLPGIESAEWLPDASLAFVRYLSGSDFSTINTYALPSSSGSSGFFLPQNLADIAVSSLGVLTLASGVNGSVASLSHTDGTHSSGVFTTPLSALHASFAGKSSYLAFTKPSATLPGGAFLVNHAGYLSRIAGPLNGLVALASPSGKWLLVSYTGDTAMQMELVNVATGENVPLPIATIADKCVWTADDSTIYCGVPVDPSGDYAYPDDWYQGVAHFSDRLWRIDVSGRYAQMILDFPNETKDSLDAEALAVNPLNTNLVFFNKNDGSLWNYQL